jgi:catechol 2,3-dioxygenase-like lactoylglutathione lyase family enzyme
MATVTVRYIVDDVDNAIAFYVDHLGFGVVMHPAPAFAMLDRGDLRLLLSAPGGQGGGGQILPGDRRPTPGGWNRFQLIVDDLAGELTRLRAVGVATRSEIVHGIGGDQVIIEDPSGNPIELFAPASVQGDEARSS